MIWEIGIYRSTYRYTDLEIRYIQVRRCRSEDLESRCLQVSINIHCDDLENIIIALTVKRVALQNLWPRLMTDKDEAKVYRALQAELEDLEGVLSEGRAALPLLEGQLMRAACDDPGPVIMGQVMLPLLQQRLTAQAEAFHASGQKPQVLYLLDSMQYLATVVACLPDASAVPCCNDNRQPQAWTHLADHEWKAVL